MSKPSSNLFHGTQGDRKTSKQLELVNFGSVDNGLNKMAQKYPVSPAGNFGKKGKGRNVRVIESNNQYSAAESFWHALSEGAKVKSVGKNKGLLVKFSDGSSAMYRVVTSTANSPAIQIKVFSKNSKYKSQKIHFVRK